MFPLLGYYKSGEGRQTEGEKWVRWGYGRLGAQPPALGWPACCAATAGLTPPCAQACKRPYLEFSGLGSWGKVLFDRKTSEILVSGTHMSTLYQGYSEWSTGWTQSGIPWGMPPHAFSCGLLLGLTLPRRTGSKSPCACSHPGPLPWLFLQNPTHTEPDTQQSQNPNLKYFRVWTEYARRFCSVRWYWFQDVFAQIQNAPSAKPSFCPWWFNQPQNVRPHYKAEVSLFTLAWTRPQNSRSATEEEKQRLPDSSKHG